MLDFDGVKIVLVVNEKLIVIRRDNKPGLRFSGMWDLPGGGRENAESPRECATREIEEELGISLQQDAFIWEKIYPTMHDQNLKAYFMVACITRKDVQSIKLGNEGQSWKLMTFNEFILDPNVIPGLKDRLKDYIESRRNSPSASGVPVVGRKVEQ